MQLPKGLTSHNGYNHSCWTTRGSRSNTLPYSRAHTPLEYSCVSKSICTNTHYVSMQRCFSHPSFSYQVFFSNPTHKRETGTGSKWETTNSNPICCLPVRLLDLTHEPHGRISSGGSHAEHWWRCSNE
jgi:hypothetical protein